jgi:transposase
LEDKDSHRRTTDELRDLVKSVRSGEFEYKERPKKSLDWSSYDEAQAYELADMLYTVRKLVDEAANRLPEPERRGPGRPTIHSPADVAKVLLMQSYFGVSNRVAAGLALVFKEKLRLSDTFSYKTIERGYDPGPVTRILEEVFRLTNEYGNAKETTFSTDGSGDPTSSKVNYESVRSEQRKKKEEEEKQKPGEGSTTTTTASTAWPSTRHDFQYGVSSIGVHTKIYAGFATTHDHSIGELSFFPSIVSQTHVNCPSMETMLGDTLYAARSPCAIVAGYGARPYFLPKVNSTFRSHGVPAWMEMTYEFVDDPQHWLEEYHMRSISETGNSMDKMRFPGKIKKRLAWRKRTEELLRKDVHNARQYSYLRYLEPKLVSPIAG